MSFFELNIATSGLFTAKAGLSVAGNNISNSAVNGYSRQYAKTRSSVPLNSVNGVGMMGTGSECYGVGQIRDVYLDRKYWNQSSTLGEYGEKNTQLELLETIFNDLSETGLSASVKDFFKQLSDLSFDADNDTYRSSVINYASSLADKMNMFGLEIREQQSQISEELYAVVTKINSTAKQLADINRQIYVAEFEGQTANELRDSRALLIDDLSKYGKVTVKEMQGNTDRETDTYYQVLFNGQELVNHMDYRQLKCTTREDLAKQNVNDIASDIAAVNKKINAAELAGNPVADLQDERNDLLDKLKNYGDVTTSQTNNPDGTTTFKTSLDGIEIVDGIDSSNFPNVPSKGVHINECDAKELYEISWSNGTKFETEGLSGQLQGLLDVMNGNNNSPNVKADYKGIPYYTSKLNSFIRTLARSINDIHANGIDRDNEQGNLFFSYVDDNGDIVEFPGDYNTATDAEKDEFYSKMNAFNFSISKELKEDVGNLACISPDSTSDGTEDGSSADKSSNQIILDIIDLVNKEDLYKEGNLYDYLNGISTSLAVDKKQANSFNEFYTDIVKTVDNQRLQVSGVSLNEEIASVIKYNQMYRASSKLISVIDDIYRNTINMV